MSDTIQTNSSSPSGYWTPPAAVQNSHNTASADTSGTLQPTAQNSDSFQKMLSELTLISSLSSMGMTGMTGSSGQSSGTGSLMGGNMMAPLMMMMMEKMLASQIQSESDTSTSSGAATPSDNPTTPAAAVKAPATVAAPETSAAGHVPHGLPVSGPISQYSHSGHIALDIAVPTGTDIKSTMDGKIIYAGWNNEGYGNLVIVENGAYRTYYAHQSQIGVSVGDKVKAGQVIGESGSTGNSTGPHVHYEVRVNLRQVDPSLYQ